MASSALQQVEMPSIFYRCALLTLLISIDLSSSVVNAGIRQPVDNASSSSVIIRSSTTTGGNNDSPLRLLLSNGDSKIVVAEIADINPSSLVDAASAYAAGDNDGDATRTWIRGQFSATNVNRVVVSNDQIVEIGYNSHSNTLVWGVDSESGFIRYKKCSHCSSPQFIRDADDNDVDNIRCEYDSDVDDSQSRCCRVSSSTNPDRLRSRESAAIPKYKQKNLVTTDVVTSGSVAGLAFDWLGNNVYWCDADSRRIEVISLAALNRRRELDLSKSAMVACDTDNADRQSHQQQPHPTWRTRGGGFNGRRSSNIFTPSSSSSNVLRPRKLLYTNLADPFGLVVAPLHGWLFWADREHHTIERGGMNGRWHREIAKDSNIRRVDSNNELMLTLSFDSVGARLYWAIGAVVSACNVDGSGRFALPMLKTNIMAMAVFGDRLFWTSPGYYFPGTVHMSDKFDGRDTGNISLIVRGRNDDPDVYVGLKVLSTLNQPTLTDNPCANSSCSALCLIAPQLHAATVGNSIISSECACSTGLLLQADGKTCYAYPRKMLLLARKVDIRMISLDNDDAADENTDDAEPQSHDSMMTATYEPLLVPGLFEKNRPGDGGGASGDEGIKNVAFDKTSMNIYWIDEKVIKRVKLQQSGGSGGTSQRREMSIVQNEVGSPQSLAVDWIARHLYWTDSYTIRIEMISLRNIDDNNNISGDDLPPRRVVVSAKSGMILQPFGVAVDSRNGYLFWSDWGKHHIARANLDGSDIRILAAERIGWCNAIVADGRYQQVYWVDGSLNTVNVVKYDGSGQRVLVTGPTVSQPIGLALLDDYLYWTNLNAKRWISRASRSVPEDVSVFNEGIPDLMGLTAVDMNDDSNDAVDNTTRSTLVVKNPCSQTNNFGAGCQEFCMFMPHRAESPYYYCACSAGFELDVRDNKSCIMPEASLMYSSASGIWLTNSSSSSSQQQLLVPARVDLMESMSGLLYEARDNATYWINTMMKTNLSSSSSSSGNNLIYEIRRAFSISNGSIAGTKLTKPQTLVEFGASGGKCEDISIDWIAGNLYWTDLELDQIEAARLDGSVRRVILWYIYNPTSIAVDPLNGHLYWTQFGVKSGDAGKQQQKDARQPQIRRANLDGSNAATLFYNIRATSLVIDFDSQVLFWFNADSGSIELYPLRAAPGTAPQLIIGSTMAHDIAVYDGWLYWSTNRGIIERINVTDNSTTSRTTVSLPVLSLSSAENAKSATPTTIRSIVLFAAQAASLSNDAIVAAASPAARGWNICAGSKWQPALCFAPSSAEQTYQYKCQSHYTFHWQPQSQQQQQLAASAAGATSNSAVAVTATGGVRRPVCRPPAQFLLYSTANNEIGRFLVQADATPTNEGDFYGGIYEKIDDVPNVRLPILPATEAAVENDVAGEFGAVTALEFDVKHRMIFWVNAKTATIYRAAESDLVSKVFVGRRLVNSTSLSSSATENVMQFSNADGYAGAAGVGGDDFYSDEYDLQQSMNAADNRAHQPLSFGSKRLRRTANSSSSASIHDDFILRSAKLQQQHKTQQPTPTTRLVNDNDYAEPFDMTLDPYSRLMIWSCALHNRINATHLDTGLALGAILDGTDASLLFDTVASASTVVGKVKPRWLALHWHERILYFVNAATNFIESTSLDGRNRQLCATLPAFGVRPRHLIIDQNYPALYWTADDSLNNNAAAGSVLKRLILPRPSDRIVIKHGIETVPASLPRAAGIAALGTGFGNVYWGVDNSASAATGGAILKLSLVERDGGGDISVQKSIVLPSSRLLRGDAGRITALLGVNTRDYDAIVDRKHPCSELPCSHFCILSFERKAECACPVGMQLSPGSFEYFQRAGSPPLPSLTAASITAATVCVRIDDCDYMCPASDGGATPRKCIRHEQKCNWQRDCPDGSDEYDCDACQLGGFRCNSSSNKGGSDAVPYCVLKHSPCNNERALSTLFTTDQGGKGGGGGVQSFGERIWTATKACPNSYWSDGRCDDISDCDDGSDEMDCNNTALLPAQQRVPKQYRAILEPSTIITNETTITMTTTMTTTTRAVESDGGGLLVSFTSDKIIVGLPTLVLVVGVVSVFAVILIIVCCCKCNRGNNAADSKQKQQRRTANMAAAAAAAVATLNADECNAITNPLLGPNIATTGMMNFNHGVIDDADGNMPFTTQHHAPPPTLLGVERNTLVPTVVGANPSHIVAAAAADVSQHHNNNLLSPVDDDENNYTASVVGQIVIAGKKLPRMPSPPPGSTAVAAEIASHSEIAQAIRQQQRTLNNPSSLRMAPAPPPTISRQSHHTVNAERQIVLQDDFAAGTNNNSYRGTAHSTPTNAAKPVAHVYNDGRVELTPAYFEQAAASAITNISHRFAGAMACGSSSNNAVTPQPFSFIQSLQPFSSPPSAGGLVSPAAVALGSNSHNQTRISPAAIAGGGGNHSTPSPRLAATPVNHNMPPFGVDQQQQQTFQNRHYLQNYQQHQLQSLASAQQQQQHSPALDSNQYNLAQRFHPSHQHPHPNNNMAALPPLPPTTTAAVRSTAAANAAAVANHMRRFQQQPTTTAAAYALQQQQQQQQPPYLPNQFLVPSSTSVAATGAAEFPPYAYNNFTNGNVQSQPFPYAFHNNNYNSSNVNNVAVASTFASNAMQQPIARGYLPTTSTTVNYSVNQVPVPSASSSSIVVGAGEEDDSATYVNFQQISAMTNFASSSLSDQHPTSWAPTTTATGGINNFEGAKNSPSLPIDPFQSDDEPIYGNAPVIQQHQQQQVHNNSPLQHFANTRSVPHKAVVTPSITANVYNRNDDADDDTDIVMSYARFPDEAAENDYDDVGDAEQQLNISRDNNDRSLPTNVRTDDPDDEDVEDAILLSKLLIERDQTSQRSEASNSSPSTARRQQQNVLSGQAALPPSRTSFSRRKMLSEYDGDDDGDDEDDNEEFESLPLNGGETLADLSQAQLSDVGESEEE